MATGERFDARGDPLVYRRAGNERDGRQSGRRIGEGSGRLKKRAKSSIYTWNLFEVVKVLVEIVLPVSKGHLLGLGGESG
jgi:hypothetical protein